LTPEKTTEENAPTGVRGVTRWHVVVSSPGGTKTAFDVIEGSPMRVGSNPSNDIVLSDATASRVHAELLAEGAGLRVVDLGSTNGCWYKGVRLADAVVPSGTVSMGESQLLISSEAPAVEPLAVVARFGSLVGKSLNMRALFHKLSLIAGSNSTVLIQAESGSGKELVARSLHEAGERKTKPYVVFDCASAAPTLIESALFGHEKGAFTGAISRKLGCFEEAEGGTLFLDEIGELPLELQPRLLRAIDSREIRRVGGDKPIPIDVRLMAATHRDLSREVNQGQFREDLYYRLAVVRLRIPPLRDRLDDLPVLVEHLMVQALDGDRTKATALVSAMTPAQWERLRKHPWRGNVRELRNAVERSLAMSTSLNPTSDFQQLIAPAASPPVARPPPGPALAVSLDHPFLEQKQQLLERFEAEYLDGMLTRHLGNLSRAAANAGIDRMYFKRLLKKYGLPRDAPG